MTFWVQDLAFYRLFFVHMDHPELLDRHVVKRDDDFTQCVPSRFAIHLDERPDVGRKVESKPPSEIGVSEGSVGRDGHIGQSMLVNCVDDFRGQGHGDRPTLGGFRKLPMDQRVRAPDVNVFGAFDERQ